MSDNLPQGIMTACFYSAFFRTFYLSIIVPYRYTASFSKIKSIFLTHPFIFISIGIAVTKR